jgi:hypothetical protein
MVAGALALTLRTWRSRPAVATGLLFAAVAVQAADTPSIWGHGHFGDAKWPRLRAPQWAAVSAPYRHVALYPTYPDCEGKVDYPFQHYLAFADLAYRQRLTLNVGSFARVDEKRALAVCVDLKADVKAGRFASNTVYVVHPTGLADFTKPGTGMVCGTLEEQHVCVAADVATPLRDFLAGTHAVAGDTAK